MSIIIQWPILIKQGILYGIISLRNTSMEFAKKKKKVYGLQDSEKIEGMENHPLLDLMSPASMEGSSVCNI